MGQKIDSDELYDDLADKLEWLMQYGEDVYLSVGSDIRRVIYEQTTAFDPDKLVDQLKNAAVERYGNDGMGGEMVVNLDDAIRIVKGDGVDDTCVRAENKGSVSQTDLEALIAKYEGYTKLNEEKPLETNSYENGENNVLLAVIADLKDMISRS